MTTTATTIVLPDKPMRMPSTTFAVVVPINDGSDDNVVVEVAPANGFFEVWLPDHRPVPIGYATTLIDVETLARAFASRWYASDIAIPTQD